MDRTPYRQRTRLSLSTRVREDSPPFGTIPFPEHDPEEDGLEELFRYLRKLEEEPASTLARQLIEDGIELPPPTSFTEESVSDKLWEVARGLARRRYFLEHTDHLSDLQLYRYLWEITLNQPAHELGDDLGECACHLDLVSDGTDESLWLWLRYYADELTRENWAADFPGGFIPAAAPLPHDRDRHLPKWYPLRP